MSGQAEHLADGKVALYCGDCLDVLKTLDANSIDACVTDPPYGLGFMGKAWDHGVPGVEYWKAVLRVLKPGAHLLAFGGTRTFGRMHVAIEEAGFEVRDMIAWLYGSGFPKSLDVSKTIDKRKDWSALPRLQNAIHAARKTLGISQSEAARRMGMIGPDEVLGGGGFMWFETGMRGPTREQWPRLKAALRMGDEFDLCFEEAEREITGTVEEWSDRSNYALTSKDGFRRDKPASSLALEWSGFGTALKPACEPIILARKPLSESTVAANVLKWGTGALNIDGCRVASGDDLNGGAYSGGERRRDEYSSTDAAPDAVALSRLNRGIGEFKQPLGRWPANVIHDGSDEVVEAFPEVRGAGSARSGSSNPQRTGYDASAYHISHDTGEMHRFGDSGSAARFFYTAKADADDRLGSKHPTVKPLDLMQYLCRLVTPPRGLIIDPFAGTGTTGEAALRESMRAILIEREAEYQDDIRRRMRLAMVGPDERTREAIKAKLKGKPVDAGPLFGGA